MRSIEQARLDKEKYYNDPFIKKCYEDGIFKDVISTDTYTICNVTNRFYVYNNYSIYDGGYCGVIFASGVLRLAQENPENGVSEYLKKRTWYLKNSLTKINEEWIKMIIGGYDERKTNPDPRINLELEEEIINKYKQK